MNVRHLMQVAALASAIGLAGSAAAADAGLSAAQMQNGGPSPAGSVQSLVPPGPASVGGTERVDNSNGIPLSDAAREYAQRNGGHLPPTVVMDSDGNAWDVVGVEPYDDTAQTSQVILLRPHAQSATVIAPDGGNTAYVEPNGERSTVIVPAGRETVYVEPNGDRVIYLFPGTDASTSSAPRGASDMQPAPDGYMGENNVRGQ